MMKIAWFSPLPPRKSGISEYSELLLSEMYHFAEIDVWVEGYEPLASITTNHKVIDYTNDQVLPLLRTYDVIVYNMGNNIQFHKDMFEVMRQYPGVVILHDLVLHNFMAGYFLGQPDGDKLYLEEISKRYGQSGYELAKQGLESGKPLWESNHVIEYPLNQAILEVAKHVIVHSAYAQEALGNFKSKSFLFSLPMWPILNYDFSRASINLPQDKLIIAAFGFIGPVKRLHKLVAAIANTPNIKARVHLLIIGESVYPEYNLREIMIQSGVLGTFTGYVDIDTVYALLNRVDVCVNLRYPTMGETSASVIRMMSLGKPILVSDVGWYRELPNDVVIKIRVSEDYEEKDLQDALVKLLDKTERESIGQRAITYAHDQWDPILLTRRLLDFLIEVSSKEFYPKCLQRVVDTLLVLESNNLIDNVATNLQWIKE